MKPAFFSPAWWRSGISGLLLLASTLLLCSAQSVPIPCDGSFYLSHTKEFEDPSTLLRIHYDEGRQLWKYDTLIANMGRQVYPIGYRVTDQLIYGMDPNTLELVSVDGAGNISVKAQMAGELDSSYRFDAGAVTPDGRFFLLVGQDKQTGIDKEIYFLNLEIPGRQAGSFSILSQGNIKIGDLSPDPLRRVINGFDAFGKSLASISYFSGIVTQHQFVSSPQVGSMGSTFFAPDGRLFGFGRNSGSVTKDHMLFEIDALKGDITAVQAGPSGKISDGCSCPYSIPFEKVISPAVAVFCDTVTLTYRWENRAGDSFIRRTLTDTLPPELKIVDVPYLPFNATVEEGPGGRVLRVAIGDFLLGPDSIKIRVGVNGNIQGRFGSRGQLSPFSMALGTVVRSDDPATAITEDASVLTVSNLKVALTAPARICPGGQVEIRSEVFPEGQELTYRWSDGSSSESLIVNQEGWYSLEVIGKCGTAIDSVFIEEPTVPLAVDLGPDLSIEQGETIRLTYQASESGPFSHFWSALPLTEGLCSDCPELEARPLQNTLFFLTLTDSFGCTATDSVRVTVDLNQEVSIGNVITPNDDGINEELYFYGKGLVQVRNLQVFDRWGKLLFVSPGGGLNDPAHGWNGRMNGKALPAGVYFWMGELEFPDGHREVKKGNVTLMK